MAVRSSVKSARRRILGSLFTVRGISAVTISDTVQFYSAQFLIAFSSDIESARPIRNWPSRQYSYRAYRSNYWGHIA
jgi:hypothetical protein